ncbi:MAG TPA: gamma-glutamyl-gamma-aminobutyrate hydrolase family protein [Gemmatimonadota bacterium]|nr:gamma-glutamyl-gamma-aminobutyrate hydrolase family protein [Gemmatimonadota bacterium]
MSGRKPLVAVTGAVRPGSEEHPGRRVVVEEGYLDGVRVAGGLPLILGPTLSPDETRDLVRRTDGLLLTGGEDLAPSLYGQEPHGAKAVSPERDAMELAALETALEEGIPVLAICRGLQLLDVHFGGSLWQDLPSERPSEVNHDRPGPDASRPVHAIRVGEPEILEGVFENLSMRTNSSHHQAIHDLGRDVEAVAWSEDGLVEAIELRGRPGGAPVVGVQWHPERMLDERTGTNRRLFEWFGRAVAGAAGRRMAV